MSCAASPTLKDAPAKPRLAAPARSVDTALLVEDDPVAAALLAQALRERGIRQVVVAGNGLAALAAMSRMAIPAQLVVCDLLMPECDGFEFMEKLGTARYAGGLLLVSGMDDRTLNSASLMARFHRLNLLGALRKPVEATALVAALARLA